MSLYKLVDGNWVLINESVTNSDGRCAEFLQRDAFRSGRYKLHFAVEKYFKTIRSATIYPFIEVCIFAQNAHIIHFHIFHDIVLLLF